MSTRIKDEARVLDNAEREMVEQTRHPHIQSIDDAALRDLLARLRDRRDRAQSLAARARRDARRGGGGFDHSNSGMRQKSGLLSEAVRRINKEVTRRKSAGRRQELIDNARHALSLKESASGPSRPSAGRTKRKGMNPVENEKARQIGSPMEAGRVSQFVKNAQARKESREG